jgi:hypothetical protein
MGYSHGLLVNAHLKRTGWEGTMLNRLCAVCMNTCKQEATVKIVRCPNFRKRLTDDEFRDLVNELDAAELRAADLSCKVKGLIDKALSAHAVHTPASSGDHDAPSRNNGDGV